MQNNSQLWPPLLNSTVWSFNERAERNSSVCTQTELSDEKKRICFTELVGSGFVVVVDRKADQLPPTLTAFNSLRFTHFLSLCVRFSDLQMLLAAVV